MNGLSAVIDRKNEFSQLTSPIITIMPDTHNTPPSNDVISEMTRVRLANAHAAQPVLVAGERRVVGVQRGGRTGLLGTLTEPLGEPALAHARGAGEQDQARASIGADLL